ncbi:hypothetical protein XENOCAPTIV_007151, partial [Xenoophorus captivus]
MAQKGGLSTKQVALPWVKVQVGLANGIKDFLEVGGDSLKAACMHKEVIQVYYTTASWDKGQHSLHQTFKGSWDITEAERHHFKLPQSLPDGEHSLGGGG